jgi:Ca2+-dependent lipid-binding protein
VPFFCSARAWRKRDASLDDADWADELRSTDMGVLKVSLADGHGIRGVDRGGKSDPFCVFSLNGQKVFKSQTKKKTLNPVWNEEFTVGVVRILRS